MRPRNSPNWAARASWVAIAAIAGCGESHSGGAPQTEEDAGSGGRPREDASGGDDEAGTRHGDAASADAIVIEGPITGPGDQFVHPLEEGLPISVADMGYVFEEYFVSGTAAGTSYAVRLRLARPGPDGPPFSGQVIVEPKHPTGVPFVWYFTREYLMARGHAAVEISTFPSTITSTLQGADPDRYADLHVTEEQTSGIFAQVGALLKGDRTPLPGTAWLVMTGHSRSAGPTWHFMDTHHGVERLDGGSSIYDGFFPETTRTASRLGPFPDVDVPTVLINSELEVEVVLVQEGIDYRKPDSDDPERPFRLYEIAGMAHNPSWQNPIVAGGGIEGVCDQALNAFPYDATVSMALDHLLHWVTEDVPPPRADRIALLGPQDAPIAIDRDAHGNALGGVRSTTLDVPVASYSALNTPDSCLVFGSQQDFDQSTLVSLYGSHTEYQTRVDARADELIAEGWLLEEFAGALRSDAAEFKGFD